LPPQPVICVLFTSVAIRFSGPSRTPVKPVPPAYSSENTKSLSRPRLASTACGLRQLIIN